MYHLDLCAVVDIPADDFTGIWHQQYHFRCLKFLCRYFAFTYNIHLSTLLVRTLDFQRVWTSSFFSLGDIWLVFDRYVCCVKFSSIGKNVALFALKRLSLYLDFCIILILLICCLSLLLFVPLHTDRFCLKSIHLLYSYLTV